MRMIFILQLFLMATFFQTPSCLNRHDDPIVKWKGPNDPIELVFFYKKDVSRDERENFENKVLHKLSPNGRGYDLQDGVVGEFSVRNAGYEGYAIEFYPNATREQRDKLKLSLESSPLVFRVYENVVPNEIDDLPGSKNAEPSRAPDARPTKVPLDTDRN
ncbi:MAG: hypothetical protein IT173_06025 [Acidobacteria bacterium]|nr:hypothetical protein [Acidobacteriota bacterium]